MMPSTSTSFPIRSARAASSPRGAVIRVNVASSVTKVHRSVGVDSGPGPLPPPALQIDGDGIHRDVRPGVFDVHRQGGCLAAEPLRTDPGQIDRLEKLLFEDSNLGLGMRLADRAL